MYLKSLVLKGFKSFADRSVLKLEPGITAIVGPNGSGKSNISDAVLWVLGERNAKNLRGQAMEDVIFAGSSARKSVGVAEVELVLDNSDGTLPVEYDEVSLTRRMYRNGESEYLINGTMARRMDFMDILHDSGIGTGTHSIIGQGNLDAILASKPEDRRALIEEAAGVLKHKQRKERSERKLASMETHLARVKDVASEVERQLKPLARKAQRARSYQKVSDELAELELVLAVDDLRRLREEWSKTELSEKESAAQIDVERIRVRNATEHVEELQKVLQEKGLYVGNLTEKRGQFHMALERMESNARLLTAKEQTITAGLASAQETFDGSSRRIVLLGDEVNALFEALNDTEAKRDALAKDAEQLAQESAVARERRVELDKQLESAQSDARTADRRIEALQSDLARRQKAQATLAARKQLLTHRIEELEGELDDAQVAAQSAQEAVSAQEEALKELEARRSEKISAAGAAQAALTECGRRLEERKARVQEAKGELVALEHVSKQLKSRTDASAWLAKAAAEKGSTHTLAELISVPAELDSVIERLLGSDLTSLVLTDAQEAEQLMGALQQQGVTGQASVLLGGREVEGPDNLLVESIQCDERIRSLMNVLVGDVLIADTLQDALALEVPRGTRIACKDGSLVWSGTKVEYGQNAGDAAGVLNRERRMAWLRESLVSLEADVVKAEEDRAQAAKDVERTREESNEAAQKLAQEKGALSSLRKDQERSASRIATVQASLRTVRNDIASVERDLASQDPDTELVQSQVEELRARREALRVQIDEVQVKRQSAAEDEQKAVAAVNEARLKLATLRERAKSAKREHEERVNDLKRAQRARDRADRDIAELSVALERIEPLRQVMSRISASAQTWVDDLAGKAALEQSMSESLTSSIAEAREAVQQAQAKLDEANEQLANVRIHKGKLEVQVDAAVSTIVDELETPLEKAMEIPAPEDRAFAEGEAFKLRRRLTSMGTIDSSAAEEYEAAKERFDYLTGQIQDVEAARRALKRIVDAIDERLQTRFDETFVQVNSNFQEIFGTLFPGGSGSLELVGGEDGVPVGVEVNAQPRGKRIKKMMLMSGGEKSLTALALLFAVYRVRQTPFYILDEAEAALDDSNLRRLISYLNTLRHDTQLIMITHQRRTMEMSDVLYGVSMQSDGVTKVVSQRLDAALAQMKR